MKQWIEDHPLAVMAILVVLLPLTLAAMLLYCIGVTGYMLLESMLDI